MQYGESALVVLLPAACSHTTTHYHIDLLRSEAGQKQEKNEGREEYKRSLRYSFSIQSSTDSHLNMSAKLVRRINSFYNIPPSLSVLL